MSHDSSLNANRNRSFHKAYTYFEDIFSYYFPGAVALFILVFIGWT